MKKVFALLILLLSNLSVSQDQTTDLDEVVVLSTKIDLPFSKNFRTVKIISSNDIKNSPATNISDLLQEITGIDVRRRGAGGVQGDLYIRGGGFDQTLLLVDGMKMDAPKTQAFMGMMKGLEVADQKTLVVLSSPNNAVYLSSRNSSKHRVMVASDLSTYDILDCNTLILVDDAHKVIEGLLK